MTEKQLEKTRDLTGITPEDALSTCLQWACSPRGGNNFYGRILNACGRRPAEGLNTVAVTLTTEGKYLFLWDKNWFVQQEAPFQLLCIVHEAGHLVLQHLERGLKIRMEINDLIKCKRLWPIVNVAMDMAVNDLTIRPMLGDTRTNFAQFKDKIVWPEDRNYPHGLAFEEYFGLLLQDLKNHGFDPNDDPRERMKQALMQALGGGGGEGEEKQKGDGGEGEGQGQGQGEGQDDPLAGAPQWFKDLLSKSFKGEISWQDAFDQMTDAEVGRVMDRAHKEAKGIVKSALEQTEKSRGTIPAGLQNLIDGLLDDPTVPWNVIFRTLAKSAISSKLDESTAYPNTALFHLEAEGIEPYPGYQKNFTFNIAVGVDTSGSVSDDEFRMFVRELLGILKTEKGISIRLLMFDAALQYEKELSDDDADHNRASGSYRYGYGGTDFAPFLRYLCNKDTSEDWEPEAIRMTQPRFQRIDLAILFTDGYAPVGPPNPIPEWLPPFPLIWALTPNGREDELMLPRVVRVQEG